MNLYVIRHAEALPAGGKIRDDRERILSPQGEKDALIIGSHLARLDQEIRLLLTSPLKRAVQTGENIARSYGRSLSSKATPNLAPGFDVSGLLREVFSLANGSNVIAVGHMPEVNYLVAHLVAHDAPTMIEMRPGTIAHIAIRGMSNRPVGQLCSILFPGMIRLMSDQ